MRAAPLLCALLVLLGAGAVAGRALSQAASPAAGATEASSSPPPSPPAASPAASTDALVGAARKPGLDLSSNPDASLLDVRVGTLQQWGTPASTGAAPLLSRYCAPACCFYPFTACLVAALQAPPTQPLAATSSGPQG